MLCKIFLIVAVAALCVSKKIEHQTPNLRIVNGNTVDPPHSAPWVVYIQIENPKESCGGTLITQNHVLTAAHCLKGNRKVEYVLAGAHNIKENEGSQQKLQAEKFLLHPQYDKPKWANDIAIIKLKTPATISGNVKIVNMAPSSEASATYDKKRPSAYGWGLIADEPKDIETDTLQVVTLPVLSNADCLKKAPNKDVFAGDMCTNSIMERDFCDGDSGGPLVLNNVQIGVISRLAGAYCQRQYPGIYSRVGYYRSWIDTTIKNL